MAAISVSPDPRALRCVEAQAAGVAASLRRARTERDLFGVPDVPIATGNGITYEIVP